MGVGVLIQQMLTSSGRGICCWSLRGAAAGQALHNGIEIWLKEEGYGVALCASGVNHSV
jgi:hypothetical protein